MGSQLLHKAPTGSEGNKPKTSEAQSWESNHNLSLSPVGATPPGKSSNGRRRPVSHFLPSLFIIATSILLT
jgi:hypothetical protein